MATPQRHHYGSLVMGLLLVALGLFFMVDQYLRINLWSYLWPFVITCIGLLFFAGMVSNGKEAGGLAIPGCMCVALGLVGFFQALFNHWVSWAYVWALIAPTSVGIGLIVFGWWSEKPELRRVGLIVTLVGLLLFITLGALFELLFAMSGTPSAGRFILPVVIIGLGLALLFGRDLGKRLASAVMGDPGPGYEQFQQSQSVESSGSAIAVAQPDTLQREDVVEPQDVANR